MIKIRIGSDHAGFKLKESIKNQFKDFEFIDYGCDSEESVDYPDIAKPLSEDVAKSSEIGILICGTGNGMSMTANKKPGIRAGLCWNVEVAKLIRQHNNANILVLPARYIEIDLAIAVIDAFLTTDFEGGRHEKRISKI